MIIAFNFQMCDITSSQSFVLRDMFSTSFYASITAFDFSKAKVPGNDEEQQQY